METLFNSIINYGYYVRLSNMDGLKAWNDMKVIISSNKELLSSIDSKLNEWNINVIINGNSTNNILEIYDYIKNTLGMHGDENDESEHKLDKETWQNYHFYLQLSRIPKNNSCSLVRILQVAYNIGQLVCIMKNTSFFSSTHKKFFLSNNLFKLSSFVSPSVYSSLSTSHLSLISSLISSSKSLTRSFYSKSSSASSSASASASASPSASDSASTITEEQVEDITESIYEIKGGYKKN